MSNTFKVLECDADFLTAALVQSKISVWYREDPTLSAILWVMGE
ncbi:hypothetical protein [Paenibacillus sp. IHB B 3415]|nr:hypothetical protein [Paenibacillus sp. IHB B 3415]